MDTKKQFMENIESLKELAVSNNYYLSRKEIEDAFKDMTIDESQKELIYSYMKSYNINVEEFDGDAGIFESDTDESSNEDEKRVLDMYKDELKTVKDYSFEEIFGFYVQKNESELVTANLKNVFEWIEPFLDRGIPTADLIGEGNLSLVTAVKELMCENVSSGKEIYAFLKEEVTEYLTIYINDMRENDNISNMAVERLNELNEVVTKLYSQNEALVKVSEIAEYMNLTEEDVKSIISFSSEKIKNLDYNYC